MVGAALGAALGAVVGAGAHLALPVVFEPRATDETYWPWFLYVVPAAAQAAIWAIVMWAASDTILP